MEATHSPRSVEPMHQGTLSHIPEGHNLNSSQYVTPFSSGEYTTLTWPVFVNIMKFLYILHSNVYCFRAEDSSVNKSMSRKYFEIQIWVATTPHTLCVFCICSTADFRNAFLKTVRQIIRESVRNMSIPATKPVTASTGTRYLRLFKELKLIQRICFTTDIDMMQFMRIKGLLYLSASSYML
jgi:hypothetical protein